MEIQAKLCLTNIYSQISEKAILQVILPNVKLNSSFKTRKERLGSTTISSFKGKYYIKDFGDPFQSKAETWYQWVARKNGWDYNTKEGFLLALHWANTQFNLNLEPPDFLIIDKNADKYNAVIPINHVFSDISTNRLPVTIQIKRCAWTKKHIKYWEQYGISKSTAISKNIIPISHYWLQNPNKTAETRVFNVQCEIVFAYYYGKNEAGNHMYKIYSPFSKFKWLSNVTEDVVENALFITVPRENLIIQSSKKDVIVMENYRDNCNIFKEWDVISPISEGIWFNGKWPILRKLYKKIIFYGNNDWNKDNNPGLNYARKWSLDFNIPFIINPDWCESSDISDYRRDNGAIKTKELLVEIENKVNLII